MNNRGKFVVFEGIDGCGKSTQTGTFAQILFNVFKRDDVCITREPTKNNSYIRDMMTSQSDATSNAELYLKVFVEDRKQHLEKVIIPALESGTHVICDRYKYSTVVYQHEQGIPKEQVVGAHEGMLVPDVVIVLDCDLEVAKERLKSRVATDAFEKDSDFQSRLRKGYLELKNLFPEENIIIIDGGRPLEEVSKDVCNAIFPVFFENNLYYPI